MAIVASLTLTCFMSFSQMSKKIQRRNSSHFSVCSASAHKQLYESKYKFHVSIFFVHICQEFISFISIVIFIRLFVQTITISNKLRALNFSSLTVIFKLFSKQLKKKLSIYLPVSIVCYPIFDLTIPFQCDIAYLVPYMQPDAAKLC